ncbi:MAG: hypothetical protein QW112_00520 [Candidatus Micrarchaeia archaeon]
MRCERCKEETYLLDKCNFCDRKICRSCIKASKNPNRLERIIICKDCWSDIDKRSKFKSYSKPGKRLEKERD